MKMMNFVKKLRGGRGMKGLVLSSHLGLHLTFAILSLIGGVQTGIPMVDLINHPSNGRGGAGKNPRGKKVDLAFHLSQQNLN